MSETACPNCGSYDNVNFYGTSSKKLGYSGLKYHCNECDTYFVAWFDATPKLYDILDKETENI